MTDAELNRILTCADPKPQVGDTIRGFPDGIAREVVAETGTAHASRASED